MSASTVATIQDLNVRQTSEFDAFETKVIDEQESLRKLNGLQQDWKDKSEVGLDRIMSDVDQFLNEELQKDAPTGELLKFKGIE